MSSLTLRLVRSNDDRAVTLEINGEAAVTANYEEHGWAGLDLMVKTVHEVAEAAGLDVYGDTGKEPQ